MQIRMLLHREVRLDHLTGTSGGTRIWPRVHQDTARLVQPVAATLREFPAPAALFPLEVVERRSAIEGLSGCQQPEDNVPPGCRTARIKLLRERVFENQYTARATELSD